MCGAHGFLVFQIHQLGKTPFILWKALFPAWSINLAHFARPEAFGEENGPRVLPGTAGEHSVAPPMGWIGPCSSESLHTGLIDLSLHNQITGIRLGCLLCLG